VGLDLPGQVLRSLQRPSESLRQPADRRRTCLGKGTLLRRLVLLPRGPFRSGLQARQMAFVFWIELA
jgi:hypothetical protein